MNNKIKFEIYKDNPPPNSRTLKSQVSELRKKIENMRLTEDEKQVINEFKNICESQARSSKEGYEFDTEDRWLKKASLLTKMLERLQ